jgi:ABC-type dipeptide/oligopeptide/nickel transport system permease subunit
MLGFIRIISGVAVFVGILFVSILVSAAIGCAVGWVAGEVTGKADNRMWGLPVSMIALPFVCIVLLLSFMSLMRRYDERNRRHGFPVVQNRGKSGNSN